MWKFELQENDDTFVIQFLRGEVVPELPAFCPHQSSSEVISEKFFISHFIGNSGVSQPLTEK